MAQGWQLWDCGNTVECVAWDISQWCQVWWWGRYCAAHCALTDPDPPLVACVAEPTNLTQGSQEVTLGQISVIPALAKESKTNKRVGAHNKLSLHTVLGWTTNYSEWKAVSLSTQKHSSGRKKIHRKIWNHIRRRSRYAYLHLHMGYQHCMAIINLSSLGFIYSNAM